jgi:hypothetical protein
MYEGYLSILSSILWPRSNPLTEENGFRKQPTLLNKSLVTPISEVDILGLRLVYCHKILPQILMLHSSPRICCTRIFYFSSHKDFTN